MSEQVQRLRLTWLINEKSITEVLKSKKIGTCGGAQGGRGGSSWTTYDLYQSIRNATILIVLVLTSSVNYTVTLKRNSFSGAGVTTYVDINILTKKK